VITFFSDRDLGRGFGALLEKAGIAIELHDGSPSALTLGPDVIRGRHFIQFRFRRRTGMV
jgi:hypothetical protein